MIGSLIERSDFEKPLSVMNLPKPFMLSEEVPLLEVIEFLQEKKIGCLLLHRDNILSGVITERDFLLKIVGVVDDWRERPVKDFMTPNPSSLTDDAMVIDAIEMVAKEQFRHIPVMDKEGHACAIISVKDLLSFMVNFFGDTITDLGVMTEWSYNNTINYGENYSSVIDGKEELISSSIFFVHLKRIIRHQAICMDMNLTVQDAIKRMQEKKVGSILLMEYETKVKGIITERDVLTKFLGKMNYKDEMPVTDFMTENPHLLLHRHTLAHAVNNMFKFRYRNTIVVNEDRYPLALIGLLEVFRYISLHLFKDHKASKF